MIEKWVGWRNPIYGTVVCEQRFRLPQQYDLRIGPSKQFRDSFFIASDFGSSLNPAAAERNLFRRLHNFALWNMLARPLPGKIACGDNPLKVEYFQFMLGSKLNYVVRNET